MANRQWFTMKYKSSRLKEFGYNINTNYIEAKRNKEIIALADNQFLRSIRDITNREFDSDKIESWYAELNKIRKKKSSPENSKRIGELKKYISDTMFIPEYITIVMEHKSHYKYLFENGLIINFTTDKETITKKYVRLSCSAGHARVSTVVFCEEKIASELELRLNNGRDLNVKLAPSKFNAYFGLAGSATKLVSPPRICVVPDYESPVKFMANFVTETEGDNDDLIETREINDMSNRFDGQGLVSVEMAKIWQQELGLDYLCAQWGDRFNFIKGMLCTFDIYGFCETENKGNFMIKTSYLDENGNKKIVNIRDYDVIITESQFKLWNSFDSMESYRKNCDKNELTWGVTLPSPKEDKDILKMNYQFLQTLNLDKSDIENICKKFVDWISGISSENMYYTLLFLLGKNTTQDKIEHYLASSENYWVKCLIVNHNLIKDEYIKKKIYDLIKTKIKNGCLGEIIVNGNFQTIISDPFAMMQHVCGREVTGLLGEDEYYSNYWNMKNVKVVDSMRAPLTYRSEHVKLNLVNTDKQEHWYKYCYTGIIVNVHGHETVNWSGSDFDLDILATTSDLTILKGVYENELPVTYKAEKPLTKIFDKQDLYNADLFAFGSIIGSITNKSTSAYALLPLFDENSREYGVLTNRLKMCTKLQSAQIDKAKIGKEVKGIPRHWVTFNKIDKNKDSDEVKKEKEFFNSILLDKHPYFFKYLYRDTKNKFNKHKNGFDLTCLQKFGISLSELIKKGNKTPHELSFVEDYFKFMPVIYSDCVMNRLCWHIESMDFKIKEKFKTGRPDGGIYKSYLSDVIADNIEIYATIILEIKDFNKAIKNMGNMGIYHSSNDEKYDEEIGVSINEHYESFKNKMESICSNSYELVNYLIKLFYVDKPSLNKDLLWNTYGDIIFENIRRRNIDPILFPFPNDKGEIEYLNKKYKLREVQFE